MTRISDKVLKYFNCLIEKVDNMQDQMDHFSCDMQATKSQMEIIELKIRVTKTQMPFPIHP